MWELVEYINPDRIGHGIKSAYDLKLMKVLSEKNTVLEVCPIGNLMTKAVKDNLELKHIIQTLLKNEVKITINTDWPETLTGGHLKNQYEYLLNNEIITPNQAETIIHWGFDHTFIPMKDKESNLYL